MISRANKMFWCLRRLKALGATNEDLKEVYIKQIRCILEYAAPVWHSSGTKEESIQIERVQKSALRIILCGNYQSYKNALEHMQIERLCRGRQKLCIKFTRKCQKVKRSVTGSKLKRKNPWQGKKFKKIRSVYSWTIRYDQSPIKYLTKLLNEQKKIK